MSCRAAILISGSGTNLQAFIDAVAAGNLELDLCVVFSNNPNAFGLQRAEKAGIPTACIEHGDFLDRESFDRAVIEELDRWNPELLILAGFMRILSPTFVKHYEGKVLNIHPALLPKYPGLNTHQRVLDAGDKWHGSTVHFVTEELDARRRTAHSRRALARRPKRDCRRAAAPRADDRTPGLPGSGRPRWFRSCGLPRRPGVDRWQACRRTHRSHISLRAAITWNTPEELVRTFP
jgi:phosphoribosylglycinamide formyltransferase-1